jgi:DNA-binding GntR family transcriptional regulator
MGRLKTTNTPDLSALLTVPNPIMLAVEQAVLRGHSWSRASAPVAEQIAVRIAGVITMDLIHVGQRLLEKDISEVLHVSRAPVREALRILERERLVEFEARRGAIVAAPDANDIRDIYVVRGAVYQILLRELMERRASDLEAVFARYMPGITKAAADLSVDSYTLETFQLNLAMTQLSSNRLVVDLLTSIALRTLRFVRLGYATNPESMRETSKTWRALQRAVQKRDIDTLLETAKKRIEGSRDAAVRAIEPSARSASRKAASTPELPRRKAARGAFA